MTERQLRKDFPLALKAARRDRKLSQEGLAKKTGLSQSWISHFERGSRLPDAHALIELHRITSVVNYIIPI